MATAVPVCLDLFDYYSRSFPDFCQDILGLDFAAHHYAMAESNIKNRFCCYEASRGHGKTELNSVAYPLWLAFRSVRPFEILIVSGTEKQTKNIIRRIQNYCESVPMLQEHLVPENKHETLWSATQIKFKNGVFIHSYSATSKSILGNHVEFLIIDDIYGDEEADIDTINHVFQYNIRPTINTKKGQLIFVGTPKSEKDIFTLVREKHKEMGFHYLRFPAVYLDKYGEWETPLWPSHFTLKELREIQAGMTMIAWSREYMLEAISEGSRLYPDSLVARATEEGLEFRTPSSDHEYFLGCDVAVSDKDRADFSVFITLEKGKDGILRQVDLQRFKGMDTDEQLKVIRGLYTKYQYSRIIVEDNGVSFALSEKVTKDSMLQGISEAFHTGSDARREEILGRIEIYMRNGNLKISKNEVLQDELSKFGVKIVKGKQKFESLGKRDDTVLSLALALEAAEKGSAFSFEFL